jgi:hypothetical protein
MAWARALAIPNAGKSIAARIAMMAITTNNSMRVKPGRLLEPPGVPAWNLPGAILLCLVFMCLQFFCSDGSCISLRPSAQPGIHCGKLRPAKEQVKKNLDGNFGGGFQFVHFVVEGQRRYW